MAKKKITLETLAAQLLKMDARIEERFAGLDARMDRGFAAVAEDIGDIREKIATKDQVLALQTQVNSIEQELRQTKIEVRLGNLEEKVFADARR